MPQITPGLTFASVNAKKILSLPGYALGALASLAVPRDRALWVFGSGPGVGEGALALYRHAVDHNPGRRHVWLARDEHDRSAAESLGIPAVVKGSARGFLYTLRAGVVVVTHGFGDANRYGIRGAFVVQLWHGIPLKLINLDSPATLRSRLLPNSTLMRGLLRRMYRTAARAIDFMPAASEVSARRLRSAFDLPDDRVVVTGDPRDDVLLAGSDAARTAAARERLFRALRMPPRSDRVLLYAPTWRDGDVDPGVPTATEWRAIADFLEAADTMLVVRPHPHGVGDYAAGFAMSDRIRLLSVTDCTDVTTVLCGIEVLITDYSSIAYDFALTGRPIAFFAPDVATYTSTRGLYVPYATFSGAREATSWGELLDLLEAVHTDPAIRKKLAEHSETLASLHHAHRDGRNTERVYSEITARLKADR